MKARPTSSDGMVVYDDVSKFFPVRIRPGQKERPEFMVALDRVNATVRKGELITLLGPSGCGKTTLLRLTAGLIAADEGRITIEGTQVTAPRKDACMVFQNFGLLPWPASAVTWRGTSSSWSGWPPSPSTIRTNCPAACSSGWASRVR
jgi:ABC-type uncharacterized transport system ATPase subunit